MLPALQESAINQTDQAAFLANLDMVIETNRPGNRMVSLLLIAIEQFNRISTSIGYNAANLLLVQFAARLGEITRKAGRIVRIGEHKFAIILDDLQNEGHIKLAINKTLRLVKMPLQVEGDNFTLPVTIGAAAWPEHADHGEGLMQRAQLALASAQERKAPFELYAPGATQEIATLWGLESDLAKALENDELEMHYQPLIDLVTGLPRGAEALMRWKSPSRGQVPPDVFIPVADKTGQINAITWFALNTALRQCKEWPARHGKVGVSVNITANVLKDPEFVDLVSEAVGMWECSFDMLTLEITEGALLDETEGSYAALRSLRKKGVRIAIDDFGTGYSSLSYFKNIPADELKVDKSFVANMVNDPKDKQIVRSIISLAHGFDLTVVAEGIETIASLEAVLALGCNRGQGYLFERPLPAHRFESWLRNYNRRNQPWFKG